MTGDACLVTSWRIKESRAGIVESERMFDVYQSTSQSTQLIWSTLSWEKVNKKRKKTIGDRSPDIFDTGEAGGRNEKYVEEEEEEDPEQEQDQKKDKSSSSEEGGELEDDDDQTMIRGVRYVKKWGKYRKTLRP